MGNPCEGEGSNKTFGGQSTHVLPAPGKKGQFIFMADKWAPKDAIDGRYLWLPIHFEGEKIKIKWMDKWNLSVFK
jgi:hypothetical protein